MGPNFNDCYFCKRKERDSDREIETHRQEGIVITEADIGVMQLLAKEHQGLLSSLEQLRKDSS